MQWKILKMDKPKIVHLRSSGGFYGAEGVILNLALELNGLINNIIVCLKNPKCSSVELVEKAKEAGIRAETVLCWGKDLRAIITIRRFTKEYEIDILHYHDYKADIFGFIAVRGLRTMIITTNHLWTKTTKVLRFYKLLDGFIIRFFNKIVAVSEEIKKEILQQFISKEKVVTMSNGINLKYLQSTLSFLILCLFFVL